MRVLKFLRLVDPDGLVSLTNIAFIVAIGKLALAPAISLTDVGTFMVAILGYSYKKYNYRQSTLNEESAEGQVTEALADQGKAVEGLVSQITDIKKTISKLSMALGFRGNDETKN